jgi:nitroimidazol reductase NimA-like FMN-containing flavoprotein (pyridoxamine 5'-phosphate oxidase superfamily)
VADQSEFLERVQEATFARATPSTVASFPERFRLSGGAIVTFLARRRTATLATTRPDGRPHAAPTGFALVDSRIVIASIAEAARVTNLRQRPHASLVVNEETPDSHGVVIIEGTTRLFTPNAAALEVRSPFRLEDGHLPNWIGTFIVLSPERIMSYGSEGFAP